MEWFMRFIFIIFFALINSTFFLNSIENSFFQKLRDKELATFNDAITLMRILYDEEDSDDIFIENILWAAGKKLFQVTIPLKPDTINPVITRQEFAYWICKVFNLTNSKSDIETNRYASYYLCIDLEILKPGRGLEDVFTGTELLDTFAFLDYFVKYNKIRPKEGVLELPKTDYDDLPEWRKVLYKELDDQRGNEKKLGENLKNINRLKNKNINEPKDQSSDTKIREKFVDDNKVEKL